MLTTCPECGGQISDTAPRCPHCGYEITHCPECGAILPPDAKVCPQCGHPLTARGTASASASNGIAGTTSSPISQTAVLPVKAGFRKRSKLVISLLAVLLVVLFATNPGKRQHEQTVSHIVNTAIEEVSDSLGQGNSWVNLGARFSSNFVQEVVGLKLHVKNYLICSVGRITYDDRDHIVTFGIAGHVFCLISKDDVKGVMMQWVKEQQDDINDLVPGIIKNFGNMIWNSIMGTGDNQSQGSQSE